MQTLAPRIERRQSLDGRLSVLVAGGEDRSPPVLLIHGLGWDAARLWSGTMERLATEGWRSVAPDLRGAGLSAPLRSPVSIPDYGADLAALLLEMDLRRPVIVGFSMGCMVAMDLVARGIEPSGLVLACGGVASTPDGEAGVEAMLARVGRLAPETFAEEQAGTVFGAAWAAGHPNALRDFVRWRAAMDQESLHHAFRAPAGCDYSVHLAHLRCPATVVAAGADAFLSVPTLRALAARIPGAAFVEIPGAGHMAPIEAPAAWSAALAAHLARVNA